MIETLNDIFDQCHHTFLASLESHVNRFLERIQPPNQDLSPSVGISQLLNLLRDVLSGGHIVDAQPSDVADVHAFSKFKKKKSCLNFKKKTTIGCEPSCGSAVAVYR